MKQPQLGAKFKRNISNTVIYIILIIVAVFWLFPFVYLFIQSVRSGSGVSLEFWPKGETFSFQHYIALFTDPKYEFWRWYGNTFFISIVTAAIQTVITLMVSYTLSRLRFKGRRALMKMMLIIGMFPGFLGMICIYRILRELNLSTSVFGLILVYISGSAMGYYISKGFFDTIPKSLDEAAMIDGASRNVIFWKIILPLAKPIVIYTILTSVIGPWGLHDGKLFNRKICSRKLDGCNRFATMADANKLGILFHEILCRCNCCFDSNRFIILLHAKILC